MGKEFISYSEWPQFQPEWILYKIQLSHTSGHTRPNTNALGWQLCTTLKICCYSRLWLIVSFYRYHSDEVLCSFLAQILFSRNPTGSLSHSFEGIVMGLVRWVSLTAPISWGYLRLEIEFCTFYNPCFQVLSRTCPFASLRQLFPPLIISLYNSFNIERKSTVKMFVVARVPTGNEWLSR